MAPLPHQERKSSRRHDDDNRVEAPLPRREKEIVTHRVLPENPHESYSSPRKWGGACGHSHNTSISSHSRTEIKEKPSKDVLTPTITAMPSGKWRRGIQEDLENMENGQTQEPKGRPESHPKEENDDSVETSKTTEVPTETKVLDVRKYYPAETLEQSIDLLIRTSKVVVFEKSWCLFSMDSKDFLLQQLGVSFVSVPVDEATDGDLIAQYIKSETKHKTFPAIFVKGDFLGGFEDVNALYSTGQLEEEYFKRVSQADRCEMEARAIKSGKMPLFWFPEKVNAYSVRVTGVLTCFTALAACIGFSSTWGPLLAAGILLDFTLRILAGPRLSPINKVACFLTKPWEPKLRLGRPKQFAACCGFMFSFLSTLCFFVPFPVHEYVGAAFILGLAIATGMEGFLDFCLGCVFFKLGIQLGVIPK